MQRSKFQTGHARQGFTLAEMMVVIVIIGLLAALVVPNVMQRLGFAQTTTAKADLTTISQAVTQYAVMNNGRYPDSLEELVTEDENGETFLGRSSLPKDPWKNEYMYDPPDRGSNYRIYSYGKDGAPGGEGDDADIDNFTILGEEE